MLPEVVMFQRWSELLFLHWTVDPSALRELVPRRLELDLRDGEAWVGLIPFTMSGIRARGLPPFPGLSKMHEINVRTYVRHGDMRGVWFFSLDATSRIAVETARAVYRLPYHQATMTLDRDGDWNEFETVRVSDRSAGCSVRYRGLGSPEHALEGSIEEFLIERYHLFASRGERLWSARVWHEPYRIEQAEDDGLEETLLSAARIERNGPPRLAHYSRSVSVRIGRLRRL